MLKAGYIRHTVNKITFSEQCYYIFGDILSSGEYGSVLSTSIFFKNNIGCSKNISYSKYEPPF